MSVELVFFFLLALGAIVTSVLVISFRNPINSAVSLVGTFLFVAGIYAMLNASFMAVIQVMVYAGAIMVLFLFVIMLLNLGDEELGERRITFTKGVSALAAVGLFCAFVVGIIGIGDKAPVEVGQSEAGKTVGVVVSGMYGQQDASQMMSLVRVNGSSVHPDTKLAAGDLVTFGTTSFRGLVRHADAPTREEIQKLHATGPDKLTPAEASKLRSDIRRWDQFGSIEEVGKLLYTKWLLPFEVTALLLLAAVVGAVVIAKRRL
jgi:NADH-quinone oxidoreductase subunit J